MQSASLPGGNSASNLLHNGNCGGRRINKSNKLNRCSNDAIVVSEGCGENKIQSLMPTVIAAFPNIVPLRRFMGLWTGSEYPRRF